MDTLIFNLCHRPSANTQAAGAKFGLRSALSSGMPDSIQAKTHSILSNFEFTQKRRAIKIHQQIRVWSAMFCGTGSIGKALPTSWRPPVPSCKVRESGHRGTCTTCTNWQAKHELWDTQNFNLGHRPFATEDSRS